jgi:hypothetical protein
MIKNQLVIYKTFATQQYIFDSSNIEQNYIQIPIPSTIKIEHITSNYPFTITDHQIYIQPIRRKTEETSIKISNSIDEISEIDIHKAMENIEIIIKYTNIKWKTIYNFFKNTNTLICYASITNDSKFDIKTNDIKIVFRSLDHEYDISQLKNLAIDIPTFHTKNMLQFDLKDLFNDQIFTISDHTNIELWRSNVSCSEIYQHHIKDTYHSFCDSFLIIETPYMLVPGHLEIYERTEENDILSLGEVNIKLYKKGEKLKIHFPKNKNIKLKNKLEQKNHSFFIEKSNCNYTSKIKKTSDGNLIVHFYLENTKLKNPSKPPTFQDGDHCIWEVICHEKETKFELQYTLE